MPFGLSNSPSTFMWIRFLAPIHWMVYSRLFRYTGFQCDSWGSYYQFTLRAWSIAIHLFVARKNMNEAWIKFFLRLCGLFNGPLYANENKWSNMISSWAEIRFRDSQLSRVRFFLSSLCFPLKDNNGADYWMYEMKFVSLDGWRWWGV